MQKILFALFAVLTVLSFSACSEKFNVAAPYKNVTVVWGFLDEADTAHYIRIQKAFLDQNKNALVMAQTADSSFYSSLNVVMEQVDFQGTGNVVSTTILNRVDLGKEGYPKQSGVFFNSPNYAYKFKGALNSYYSYRLLMTNPTNGETDSVETPVIDNFGPTFGVSLLDDTVNMTPELDFSSTNQYIYSEILATYNVASGYSYYGQNTPIAIAQVVLQFNWADSNLINGTKTARSFIYDFGYTTLTNGQLDYKIYNTQLYNALYDALGAAPANTARLMDRCQLYIYLSTSDFSYYEQVQQTQGSGLTGNEIEPIYTNIKGKNVLGLFTARGERSGYVTISPNTIDSLENSSLLSSSNIKGTVYH